jgi:hypothetical protein
MVEEKIEIKWYPAGQRIFLAVLFLAGGLFFIWIFWIQKVSPFSLSILWALFAVIFSWAGAYWLFFPRVLAVLGPQGMDYINQDLAFFLIFKRCTIVWDRVTDIRTYEESGNGGPVLITRVQATDEQNPRKVLRFQITSRQVGYYRFLEFLKRVVDPATVQKNGLGMDADKLRGKLRRDRIYGWIKLALTFVLAVLFLAYFYFLRK